uniref:Uncharacterized protein LOC103492829 isoform X2 n=1 Tax=Rhizophora mucronata TaxID=61149 RepID=A0A2P2MTR2_RHIMU
MPRNGYNSLRKDSQFILTHAIRHKDHKPRKNKDSLTKIKPTHLGALRKQLSPCSLGIQFCSLCWFLFRPVQSRTHSLGFLPINRSFT